MIQRDAKHVIKECVLIKNKKSSILIPIQKNKISWLYPNIMIQTKNI